ncbi:MAG: zinc ribbon domain-containing protein [Actinobacteria bacterium]|nr:zinc ribbon domain-containing protein [Actinomycetota bacterium]
MFCPSCGVGAQTGQKFCSSCGASLTGVPLGDISDLPTEAVPAAGAFLPPPSFAPPPAPTNSSAPTPPTVVEPAPLDPTVFDFEQYDTTGSLQVITPPTDVLPTQAQGPVTAEVPAVEDAQPFGLTPLLILAVLTGAVTILAAVLDQISYRVSGDVNDALSLTMNDLSSNSLVACIIASVLLVAGAAIGATGRRIGVGLAGGTGLALAGFAAFTASQDVAVLDTLKRGLAEGGITYQLTTTLEVGFWLSIATAVLGALIAGVSVVGALDRRARIHPAVGAAGVLGTLAVVIGSLLPQQSGALADNFSSDQAVGAVQFWKAFFRLTLDIDHASQPPITTYLRLLVLFLLLVGGLVGFIAGTRWGVGMALGSVSVSVWLWASSWAEVGDLPFGIASGNVGSTDFTPHVVTSVGMVVVLVSTCTGAVLAFTSQRR